MIGAFTETFTTLFTTLIGATVLFTEGLTIDPIGGLVFTILTTDLDMVIMVIPTVIRDTKTEDITEINIIEAMLVLDIPEDIITIQGQIFQGEVVLSKTILEGITQGLR